METVIEEEKSIIFEQPIIASKDYGWVRDEAMAVVFHTPATILTCAEKANLNGWNLAV